MHPAFYKLTTYMRGGERENTLDELIEKTVQAVIQAEKRRLYEHNH